MMKKSVIDYLMKSLLAVSVYLIIASIFGLSPFSYQVFAKSAKSDPDDSNAKHNGDSSSSKVVVEAPAQGGAGQKDVLISKPKDLATQGGSDDNSLQPLHPPGSGCSVCLESADLAGSHTTSPTSSDPAKPTREPELPQPSPASDIISSARSSSSDLGPSSSMLNRGSGADRNPDDHDQATFRHNAQDIAMELSGLTPQEIKQYPITDLSNDDIMLVFRFLDPPDLTKVLLHIPQQDLITIEHRLTHHDFDEYLNRLAESDRIHVEGRLASTSGSSLN
jgi:hypothetical protein